MKKVHDMPPSQHKIGAFGIMMLLAFTLGGCERKPTAPPQIPPEESVLQSDTALVLQAKIEPVPLVIPTCEGQLCPQIKIQRLNSNYPEIDQAIDHYTLNYVKNLVQGFDLDTHKNNTEEKVAPEASSPIDTMSEQQIIAQKQSANGQNNHDAPNTETVELQRYIDQFLILAEEVKSLGSSSQLNLYIKPQVLNPDAAVTTVVINSSNYIGGAHGSSAQQYLNFELETRSILNLNQIIQNGQRKAFNDLAYAAFQQWIQQTQPDMEVKTYQELWKFTLSENFYLSPNGLILQYGEYEIGPYAVGLPRLVIPYEKLQGILKPQYLPVLTEQPNPQPANTTTDKTKTVKS